MSLLVPYVVSFLSKLTYVFLTGYVLGYLYAATLFTQWSFRIISDPSDNIWAVKAREAPSVLNDSSLGQHGFVQTDSVRLHYVENGDRSKPLMLLVHGFPGFWYSWRHQLKEFSTDYWVVAVDMRGYGESSKPVGVEQYKADIVAEDIKAFVKALGREKCILVGHDWGGIISFYFLLKNPHMVYSYMILNSGHPYSVLRGMRTSLPMIKRFWYSFFYQVPKIPELAWTADDMLMLEGAVVSSKEPSTITKNDIEVYKYNWAKNGFTSALNLYRANLYFETSRRLLSLGNSSDLPYGLMMFGNKDTILDMVQNTTCKMVTNLKYVEIDGNHYVNEDNPNATNKEMRAFLKACPVNDSR